ncbi:hypothetical protein C5B91_20225 [Haloferax sp. Atlit-10N]|uniref:hypothetical protein n=1 Tax=unclassified Haloferax TaxID=2625095 RepID=UPI000E261CA8|nr:MULTISPECIES: hypothetical protein [unclassified Haloferax]RDZ39421.1 hypothetical protein C5B87_19485 [Haloferax sp. Atlit-16N]RDZ53936.1 hypothetical protein C5B91_20225 [Haloferax sp. Atlit-10N]
MAASLAVVIAATAQIPYEAGVWEPDTYYTHVGLIQSILTQNGFDPIGRLFFPLHHVLVAEASLFSGLSAFWTYVVVATIIYSGICVISFLLARRFVNSKAAGIAAMVPAVADYGNFTLTHPGKMTFGYGILLVALVCLYIYDRNQRVEAAVLTFLAMFAMVIIHPFSGAVMWMILIVLSLVSGRRAFGLPAVVYSILFWGYFVTAAHPHWTRFIGAAVIDVMDVVTATGEESVQGASRFATLSFDLVFQMFGQAVLLFGAVWGGLYILNKYDRLLRFREPIAITTLTLGVAAVGSVVNVSYILPQRWYLLGYLFGINVLFGLAISRLEKPQIAVAAIFLLAILAPASAIAGFSSAMFYDDPYFKSYGTAEEIEAQPWIDGYADGELYGPHGVMYSAQSRESQLYRPSGGLQTTAITEDDLLIYDREYERTGFIVSGTGMQVGDRDYLYPQERGLASNLSKIYENGEIGMYENATT